MQLYNYNSSDYCIDVYRKFHDPYLEFLYISNPSIFLPLLFKSTKTEKCIVALFMCYPHIVMGVSISWSGPKFWTNNNDLLVVVYTNRGKFFHIS